MAAKDPDILLSAQRTRRRRRFARRFISPFVVLIVAMGIVWWSGQRDEQTRRMMHAEVSQLVLAAARGEDLAGWIRADAMIEPAIRRAIGLIGGRIGDDANALGVAIESGDVEHAAGPEASHHAVIRISGEAILGLRLTMDGDGRMVILGYWVPPDEGDAAPGAGPADEHGG
jgi:hypothetical protein